MNQHRNLKCPDHSPKRMAGESILHKINRSVYGSDSVVRWYRDLDINYKVEAVMLDRLIPVIKDKKLLDIGIGGGRTTKYLLEISSDYTGIDYSLRFTGLVKGKYPNATILCADARNPPLSDNTFDFALFSLNGLDYIGHDDWLRTLREIYRILRPGSFYMFSTHNREYKGFRKLPWQEETAFSLKHVKSCLYTSVLWPKHLLMRKHEVFTNKYAIVNDSAHGFSLLTYYISIDDQIKQLQDEGFVNIDAYEMNGNRIEADAESPWTYYLAQKPAAESY